jgi:metal-responsive CopG/Arc/MetJ family transcriptional regulator
MKTAISIPDLIFKQAEHLAHKQGISRSELYTKAINEYIKEREEKNITESLNCIYENNPAIINKGIYSIQYSTLKDDDEKW